jgi:hypothetical protein
MKTNFRKYMIGLLMMVLLAVTIARPATAAQAAPAGQASVIAWNSIMLRTVITMGQTPAPSSFVYAAYAQAAVYNAVVAIQGGYQPYGGGVPANPGASVDAAVAAAAYHVLVHYFDSTGQKNLLDQDYAASLAAIPDSTAKTAGIETGTLAAQHIISLRSGDGLNANIGFVMPSPAPGVWQLPTGVNPLVPWMSKLKPFMLQSPSQFRPSPPPDLSSSEWAEEYNEVLRVGRNITQYRTTEQTTTARFWGSVPLPQYNVAYQQIATSKNLSALSTARLMAMGNMVASDALIGCFDAKYHYLFWRPVYAIPQGDTDGNPNTPGDPTFIPLLPTPPHPEYPSAHSCLTSSQAEVFAEFLGTQHIKVTITSTNGTPARYYATANDLTKEIIDARVWAGIHYRESNVKGVNLGRKVAHWTLERYFLPEN